MSTLLTKDLTREVRIGIHTYIITISPNGTISFRDKGKKTKYRAALGYCRSLAILTENELRYREAMEEYKRKLSAGYKHLKKPKYHNVSDFFNPILRKAINLTPKRLTASKEEYHN